MKLKTLSLLAASAGLALLLTGCNDPYHGPAYASVTIAAPLGHGYQHRPHHRAYPVRPLPPRVVCRGHGCRSMPHHYRR